jgi:hypothetical protein
VTHERLAGSMEDFLATVLSFPTVVYTTGLGLVLVYWLTVILGALDVDIFGVDGDLDLDVDVADGNAEGLSGLTSILTVLRLRHAPLTVTFSVVTLAAWLFSYVGARRRGRRCWWALWPSCCLSRSHR